MSRADGGRTSSMCLDGTISSLRPDRSRIGRSAGSFSNCERLSHFWCSSHVKDASGGASDGMSSVMLVNVFSRMSAAGTEGFSAARLMATAPPIDWPKKTMGPLPRTGWLVMKSRAVCASL